MSAMVTERSKNQLVGVIRALSRETEWLPPALGGTLTKATSQS